jgi:hypothetical protein
MLMTGRPGPAGKQGRTVAILSADLHARSCSQVGYQVRYPPLGATVLLRRWPAVAVHKTTLWQAAGAGRGSGHPGTNRQRQGIGPSLLPLRHGRSSSQSSNGGSTS